MLDVDEPGGSKSLITLDQLQFYTSKVGSQATSNVGSLGTLRYTFSSGDSVILDASRNHGSGSGDMYAYIPTSDFAGTKTSDFVYLYAHFGTTDNSQAGFEEWALVSAAPIPEMNALFPIIGLFALAFATQYLRRRHARQLGDIEFSRVHIAVFGGGDSNCRFRFFFESDGAVLQTVSPHA